MEISVDRERCQAAGMCVLTAPDLFEQATEDGRVLLMRARPPREHHVAVREAVELCPSGAITIVEGEAPM
jgi:ferredoxin